MDKIPQEIRQILDTLQGHGKKAFLVGGCVRDMLMGRLPQDYDICTDALPQETMEIFDSFAVPTGLRHGTVTVRSGGRTAEVTTFRQDGEYMDHRHPQQVSYTSSLEEDLLRRDFTINAMAMDQTGCLVDPCHGQEDLERKILRCVGQPRQRFEEDALRIMRALRFSAVLGFALEKDTAQELRRQAPLLQTIAAERLQSELSKMICGKWMRGVLMEYPDVLGVILPEILPCVGFHQNNRHHCYTVWEHTVRAMEAIAPQETLRYTMLLHDLGKPACYTTDAAGNGHFYGHPQQSLQIAEKVTERLRMDHEKRDRILRLVMWHDYRFPPEKKYLLKLLEKVGEEETRLLLQVQRADNAAQAPEFSRQAELARDGQLLDEILKERLCFSVKSLAVNGNDLLNIGISGPGIGKMLQRLLLEVMEERLPNEREALLVYAEKTRDSLDW